MSARFEELGWQQTPMGVISLRRRFDPTVRADVFEVKLDDEHLMSSLFTVAEKELARLALARTPGEDLDVVVEPFHAPEPRVQVTHRVVLAVLRRGDVGEGIDA